MTNDEQKMIDAADAAVHQYMRNYEQYDQVPDAEETVRITIKAAKAYFLSTLEKGDSCHCPTCGRYAQVYMRGITKTVAKQLAALYQKQRSIGDYVHVRDLVMGASGSGDFSKALYFGLIEEKPNTSEKQKTSGYWRLTAKGKLFIQGHIRIPRRAAVYNGDVLFFTPETVSFKDCYGEGFDYQKLMSERAYEQGGE